MPLGPFEDDHRGRYCVDCGGKNLVFSRAATAGLYEGPLAEVIKAYKYTPRSRCAHLAGYLSRLLKTRLLSEECELAASEADLVLPVPMHRGRRRRRGFDSVAELARLTARGLGLRMVAGLLLKTRPTRPQMGLSRPARLENVGGCFSVSRPAEIRGKLVLLVDDVITTCATSEECARTLRTAGAREVRVAAVARAIEGRQSPPPPPR
jgi:ComF family protein